jgi:hypothetical protein
VTPAIALRGNAMRLENAALPAGISPAIANTSQVTATSSEPESGEETAAIAFR